MARNKHPSRWLPAALGTERLGIAHNQATDARRAAAEPNRQMVEDFRRVKAEVLVLAGMPWTPECSQEWTQLKGSARINVRWPLVMGSREGLGVIPLENHEEGKVMARSALILPGNNTQRTATDLKLPASLDTPSFPATIGWHLRSKS